MTGNRSRKGLLAVIMAAVVFATAAGADEPTEEEAALIETGKRQWIRCSGCHSLSADAPPMFGPHLEGIVGRVAGSVEGFEYTEPTLIERSFVWNEAYFDEWLTDPRAEYPHMCLAFHGLSNPETRKALIAFLKRPAP